MSEAAARPRTFLAAAPSSPFCDGCGYRQYVEQLDRALVHLELDPSHVVVVSDIGCVGAIDSSFALPHTMHATHGRSLAFATGLELADAILHDSRLKTIVAVGDGGAVAGLSHLLHAALMNVDLTVLVANNCLLGLSGGQPSSLCPNGPEKTAAAGGRLTPALDVCALAAQCGAGFVARVAADDSDLWRVMSKAIAHKGFSVLEVVVGCPRYASGPGATDHALAEQLAARKHALGALVDGPARPEFGEIYKETAAAAVPVPEGPVPQLYSSPVRRTVRWVIADRATERIDWAAGVLTCAAAISGSRVAQKNEPAGLPGGGFAVSEVCMSPDEIGYPGCAEEPDVMVVASVEGLAEVDASGALARLPARGLLVIDETLPEPDTAAAVIKGPFRALCTPARAAMAALVVANRRVRAVPERALFAAIGMSAPDDVSLYRDDASRIVSRLSL